MRIDVLGFFFFQAEDGIRYLVRSRGLGDVYKRQVWSFVIAILGVIVIGAFFRFTRTGLAMRCTSEDHELAQSIGLRIHRIFGISWALAGVVATTGGILLATSSGLDLSLSIVVLAAFPAVLLGGLESIPGTIIGGLLLGLAHGGSTPTRATAHLWQQITGKPAPPVLYTNLGSEKFGRYRDDCRAQGLPAPYQGLVDEDDQFRYRTWIAAQTDWLDEVRAQILNATGQRVPDTILVIDETIAEGRAMGDAVKKYKRVFQCGSQQRSDVRVRRACAIVGNGGVGVVVHRGNREGIGGSRGGCAGAACSGAERPVRLPQPRALRHRLGRDGRGRILL